MSAIGVKPGSLTRTLKPSVAKVRPVFKVLKQPPGPGGSSLGALGFGGHAFQAALPPPNPARYVKLIVVAILSACGDHSLGAVPADAAHDISGEVGDAGPDGTAGTDGGADAAADGGLECELDVCGAPCAAPQRCLARVADANCDNWWPCDLAADDTTLYWTDRNDGAIMTVPKAGGPTGVLASGQAGASRIAVYAGDVYWTACDAGTVSKAPSAGGQVTTLAARPGDCPYALAVGDAGVFFATDYAIMKTEADGGPSAMLDWTGIFDMTADSASLYWAGATAVKGALAGSSITLPVTFLAPQGYDARGVALDDASVYVGIHAINSGPGIVMKVPKNGGPSVTLASGQSPYRVAVDEQDVFWTDLDHGTVMKVSIHGGTPLLLASGQRNPLAIVVDGTSAYWTTDDAIMRLTPK